MMPNIFIDIPDIEESIDREVAVNVTKQLCDAMGMKTRPVVVYNGYSEDRPSSGSQDGANTQRVELNSEDTVYVQYEEEQVDYVIHGVASTYKPNEVYLLHDDKHRISLWCNHVPTKGRLSFHYDGVDRNRMQQLDAHLRAKYFRHHQHFLVEPEYHYFINNQAIFTISELFKLTKNIEDDGEEIQDYLTRLLIFPIRTYNRADGLPTMLYKKERHTGVFGHIEEETRVILERGGEGNRGTLIYTFEFMYYKPNNLRLEYPNIICQRVIPKELRIFNQPYDAERKKKHISISDFNNWRKTPQLNPNDWWQRHEMLRYPNWDEWSKPDLKDYQLPIFSYVTNINKADRKTLISLASFDRHYKINEYVRAYMEDSGGEMLTVNKSAVMLTVFYSDLRMSGDIFDYNLDNHVISAKEDLPDYPIYRIVMSLNRNVLNEEFNRELFLKHGEAARVILKTMYPNWDGLVNLINGRFPNDKFEEVVNKYYRDHERFHNMHYATLGVASRQKKV